MYITNIKLKINCHPQDCLQYVLTRNNLICLLSQPCSLCTPEVKNRVWFGYSHLTNTSCGLCSLVRQTRIGLENDDLETSTTAKQNQTRKTTKLLTAVNIHIATIQMVIHHPHCPMHRLPILHQVFQL